MWTKTIRDLRERRAGGVVATFVVAVAAAIGYLVIGVVRSDPTLAVGGPVIMIGYIAVLAVLRNRSESAALLSRGPADERQAQVMLRATAFMGHVLVVVLVVGAMVSLAIGSQYIGIFCGLCAVAGAAFGGATVWYSRRG
jgi:uncharacterized membrane protein